MKPLARFGDGGGRNAQKDSLFGDGEPQVRKDVGADVAFRESGMRYLKGFRSKIEGVTEHAFQFDPFSVLDVPGSGVELFEQVVLSRQRLHKDIGVDIMFSAFVNLTPTVGLWSMNYTMGIQGQRLNINVEDPREASG